MSDFHVNVFVHEQVFIFEPSQVEPIEDLWVPTQPGHVGCVLLDTRQSLRICQEAIDLMRSLSRCCDDISEVSWWACDDGRHAFSWLGAIFMTQPSWLAQLTHACGVFPEECSIVPNTPPPEAVAAIEQKQYVWREPRQYVPPGSEPDDP